ncbi:zinc-ribbon domain-containing protein [Paraburkholderia diazotrophica]|uniref:zinc-ribbon domain-containing protein n=1 Tax=Paraburkholderia diazotrophica TaxID=667676 RepID=UPI00317612DD
MPTTDHDLDPILKHADADDLGVLVDYITDNGTGRLALDSDVCRVLDSARRSGRFGTHERALIGKEIRLFGGNSIMNLFRSDGVPYAEVLRDVVSHMGVKFSKADSVEQMEAALLVDVMKRAFEKMSDAERRQILDELGIAYSGMGPAAMAAVFAAMKMSGFSIYKIALIVANALARSLVGRGLTLGANAAITRGLGIALGPIGWAVTGLWSIADLASPAYRVTVPCVIQIAYMRQKAAAGSQCPACHEQVDADARFCPHCGHRLQTLRLPAA